MWHGADGLPAGTGADDLLDLGSTSTTLATVASIDDLAAVVHIGHPAQPSHDLERALLAAAPSLLITSAVAVPAQWVWAGRPGQATGSVVVDEAGMRDCRHVLRTLGANPRLVPSRTALAERIALAGPSGTLVVERSEIPAGWEEIPAANGSARAHRSGTASSSRGARLSPSRARRRCGSRSARATTTADRSSRPYRSSRRAVSTCSTCAATVRSPGRTSSSRRSRAPTSRCCRRSSGSSLRATSLTGSWPCYPAGTSSRSGRAGAAVDAGARGRMSTVAYLGPEGTFTHQAAAQWVRAQEPVGAARRRRPSRAVWAPQAGRRSSSWPPGP
ncbi:hypothetical protein NKG05_23455 [Oerskovia sp. M15]